MRECLGKWSAGVLAVLVIFGSATETVQAGSLRTVAQWQQQAEKLQGNKQLSTYDEAIRQYPAYVDFYIKRGRIYLQRGESQLARLDFDKAILLDDQNAVASFADYDKAAQLVTAEDDPRRLKIALQKLGTQLKYAAVQKGYYAAIVNSVDIILGMKKQKISTRQLEYLYTSRCLANYELEPCG